MCLDEALHCDLVNIMKEQDGSIYNTLHVMQIRGKHISWQHLRTLYQAKISMAQRSNGLYLLKKLSKEHIDLTSYSRMRVDLLHKCAFSISFSDPLPLPHPSLIPCSLLTCSSYFVLELLHN